MSEPIDRTKHYKKAVELAEQAEDLLRSMLGKPEDVAAFTRLAELHLKLHADQPWPLMEPPTPPVEWS